MGIFNAGHLAKRRASRNPTQGAFFYDWIQTSLKERLGVVKRGFDQGVIVGPCSNIFSKIIPSTEIIQVENTDGLTPASFDIVLSVLDLHSVENVPQYLSDMRKLLVPDGLFMTVFCGGDTLIELRHACQKTDLDMYGGVYPRVHPMIALPDVAALMQGAGFQMPVIDHEKKRILYDRPDKAWKDLKALGETNCLARRYKGLTSKVYFEKLLTHYPIRDGDDYVATVDMIFASGWTPGPDQQKPLKPGSAETLLEDVL